MHQIQKSLRRARLLRNDNAEYRGAYWTSDYRRRARRAERRASKALTRA